jgi:hypothetical protein
MLVGNVVQYILSPADADEVNTVLNVEHGAAAGGWRPVGEQAAEGTILPLVVTTTYPSGRVRRSRAHPGQLLALAEECPAG